MKITIVYDNKTWREGLRADRGFACVVEAHGKNILFDTGANGSILLNNMKKLNIEPNAIDEIFISHDHWDHIGGVKSFFSLQPVKVYVPSLCKELAGVDKVIRIKEPVEIYDNIYSTGELNCLEQSLIVKTEGGLVVIVGCAHPGIHGILNAASHFGKPLALIGGFHGFSKFDLINDLELVCPGHCTTHISEIKALYPDKYVISGVGEIIEI